MPSQQISSVENNFTKGLITEFTGMNFPENAATDTDNCAYTIVGDVTRRQGIDYETNFGTNTLDRTGRAINTYKWNNAGGDGSTQIIVTQVGKTLNFYLSSSSTITNPLSKQILFSTVDITSFQTGVTPDPSTQECQFTDGNGYLFVFHPSCDPFFCSYNAGVITAKLISIKIRDFTGVSELGIPVNQRPVTLSAAHNYNLINQGWTQGSPWLAQSVGSSPTVISSGSVSFTVASGITGVSNGQQVSVTTTTDTNPGGIYTPAGTFMMGGTVTSYVGTTLTINVTGSNGTYIGSALGPYYITPINSGYINTWFSAEGNYPSNADVWWFFKNASNTFDPATTAVQVSLNAGQAPQGHFIFSAFNQQRSLISTVAGLTDVTTAVRPRTGTWFQGRVWYAGVDASQVAGGTANFYTWTENIYFSQISLTTDDFGLCYQTNDPTSETLFDLLPTDGGVIQIQGAGAIYKLFPIQNGMLVFAANGVWFITGSQGIGFSANDFTSTKISSVQSISSTSFVDVQGLPYFWNAEGIYAVKPSQGGGLTVEPITVGTILSFYNSIPTASKKFARGYYHPLDYVIQWIYNDQDNNADLTLRYSYDHILNYNVYNKAFYPYSINANGLSTDPFINGILYVSSPGNTSSTSPAPGFKYLTSTSSAGSYKFTFSDEHDSNNLDWFSLDNVGNSYESFFVTGYKLHGKGQMRFQIPYLYMYYRLNEERNASYIQGQWDYAITGDSGRWSTAQLVNMYNNNYAVMPRRVKIRGRGLVLQIKVSSVGNLPFDIIGWSIYETVNTGV